MKIEGRERDLTSYQRVGLVVVFWHSRLSWILFWNLWSGKVLHLSPAIFYFYPLVAFRRSAKIIKAHRQLF